MFTSKIFKWQNQSKVNKILGIGFTSLALLTLNACFENDPVRVGDSNSQGALDSCEMRSTPGNPNYVAPPKRVIGYLPTWNNFDNMALKFDFTGFTHVDVAFINVSQDDQHVFFGSRDYAPDEISDDVWNQFVDKVHAAGAKVILSLGGATGQGYNQMLGVDSLRNKIAEELVDFVKVKRADGIDIDIEWDQVNKSGYPLFVDTLKNALKKEGYVLSAAIARGMVGSYISGQTLQMFDFVGIMSYDYVGSWDWNKYSRPLYSGYPAKNHSPLSNALSDLAYFAKEAGICKDRAVLGVPFYGLSFNVHKLGTKDASGKDLYDYTASQIGYNEILAMHDTAWKTDSINVGPTNNPPLTEAYIYNSMETIRKKTEAAKAYGGVMVWELTEDAFENNNLKFHEKALMPVIINEMKK